MVDSFWRGTSSQYRRAPGILGPPHNEEVKVDRKSQTSRYLFDGDEIAKLNPQTNTLTLTFWTINRAPFSGGWDQLRLKHILKKVNFGLDSKRKHPELVDYATQQRYGIVKKMHINLATRKVDPIILPASETKKIRRLRTLYATASTFIAEKNVVWITNLLNQKTIVCIKKYGSILERRFIVITVKDESFSNLSFQASFGRANILKIEKAIKTRDVAPLVKDAINGLNTKLVIKELAGMGISFDAIPKPFRSTICLKKLCGDE